MSEEHYVENGSNILKCRCGLIPRLEFCDDYYYKTTQYAYFCDCGAAGPQADSPGEALDKWNSWRKKHE